MSMAEFDPDKAFAELTASTTFEMDLAEVEAESLAELPEVKVKVEWMQCSHVMPAVAEHMRQHLTASLMHSRGVSAAVCARTLELCEQQLTEERHGKA